MTRRASLRLGVWQDETPRGGVDAVVTRISEALAEARIAEVDLVVFPECFLTGYYTETDNVPALAQSVTSNLRRRLHGLADTSGVGFVLGTYEPQPAGVGNAALVCLPGVPADHIYRKRALYGDWEKAAFTRGTDPCVFEYRGYRFALLICFDVEFPELVREAAMAGVDAVLVPTALMEPDHWIADYVVQSRAIENTLTVAYANRIGREGHLTFLGKSQICDPLAQARVVAPEGFRGLLHAPLTQADVPADYLTEIEDQGLPHIGQ